MSLSYDVLVTLPPRAVLPDGSSARPLPAWSPISSTLIYGEQDAILVDAPHTADRAREVADWVVASGKNVVAMYATHGHSDHWFGFAAVAKHFPGAAVLGTPGTVAVARQNFAQLSIWETLFPGQLVADVIVPTPIYDNTFLLEGDEIHFVEAGHSDTQDTTFVHVPSLDLVVAGDIVYNGVHQMLAQGDAAARREWLAAIDKIAALKPKTVISGHKAPGADDDGPRQLKQTRQYLVDAEELSRIAGNAREFADLMTLQYLSWVNPSILAMSAESLFPGTKVG
jgi:glyoxylase-like metal-dependent hydrolase (beta-lactamase superfamily II)